MSLLRRRARRRLPASVLACAVLALLLSPLACRCSEPAPQNFAGRLEHAVDSEFSRIRIRRQGTVRSMLFERDSGEEVLESQIDLRRPHELKFEYLKFLFTSYLLKNPQEDVLIIGLGGGGMIHFLRQFDPNVRIDAVEIDPVVVELADKYFGVRTEGNTAITTADGFQFIADAKKKYDVIYMDAFLKPSEATDDTGAPLTLRTDEFYQQLQGILKPGGVVAFNLNPHKELEKDVRAIVAAFPQTYVFPLSRYAGAVVVGSTDDERLGPVELASRGRGLDRQYKSSLWFEEMARRVKR
jgi:spermidine synthase